MVRYSDRSSVTASLRQVVGGGRSGRGSAVGLVGGRGGDDNGRVRVAGAVAAAGSTAAGAHEEEGNGCVVFEKGA